MAFLVSDPALGVLELAHECSATRHCAGKCGLRAQTLDIFLPENREDLFISVLYSAASACKRLQLLALASGDYMVDNRKGAVVRTCGSYLHNKTYTLGSSWKGRGPG